MKDQSYNGTITNDSGDTQMAIIKLLVEIENQLNAIADVEDAFINGLLTAAKERFRTAKESIVNAYVSNQSLSSSALSTILESCKKLRALVESGLPQQVPTIDFARATVIFADNVANFVRADESAPSTQEREKIAEVPKRDVEDVGLKTSPDIAPYTRVGNYLYFGTYPQTKVSDSATQSALTSMAGTLPTSSNSKAWTSYGYYINGAVTNFMWYIDLAYNGEKYRGVYFTQYRPQITTDSSGASNSHQDDNGYNTSTVYWFKYEPIKWRILTESNDEALVLCEMIIDSQEYYPSSSRSTFSHNGGTGYANNYALSNIRKWLNETFYNTAFTQLQKELILLTTVDNSARSTNPASNATQWNSGNNNCACANTEDYIFLLSEQEVTTAAYGFSSYSTSDTACRKQHTDYARCQGATYPGLWAKDSPFKDNGEWWLRSPNFYISLSYRELLIGIHGYAGSTIEARSVGSDGSAGRNSHVYLADLGVAPALKIKLS